MPKFYAETMLVSRTIKPLFSRFYHHRVSRLFQPWTVIPKGGKVTKEEASSLSQKLLANSGILNSRSNGMYAFLPLGQRALMKLMRVIDEEMESVDAQRLSLPLLTPGHLWKKTGRWDSTGQELLKVKDRHEKEYVLSPTHEEAIVNLIADVYPLSYRQLPLRLYQITTKIRDEMKPRFGLLRCKEFLMKDLYTFDESEETAVVTYHKIGEAYDRIFQRIGVPFIKVEGDCGNIGGRFSHEYHYPADIGEDTLLFCQNCKTATNAELLSDSSHSCSNCSAQMTKTIGIEVGHTFCLGTEYSKPLNCCYQNEKGKPSLMQMGCYGLGVSRILSAAVEVLSQGEQIRWPWILAPYKVCIISPKRGSKEARTLSWVDHLAQEINKIPSLHDDVIVDDRDSLSIGKRVLEAKKTGYPIIVVVGKKACESVPLFEIIDMENEGTQNLTQKETLNYLWECVKRNGC